MDLISFPSMSEHGESGLPLLRRMEVLPDSQLVLGEPVKAKHLFSVSHYSLSNSKRFYHGAHAGYTTPTLEFDLDRATQPKLERGERKWLVPTAELADQLSEAQNKRIVTYRDNARVYAFLREQVVPFLAAHRSIYFKDAEGRGGRSAFRVRVEDGKVVLNATQRDLVRFSSIARVLHLPELKGVDFDPEESDAGHKGIILGKFEDFRTPRVLALCALGLLSSTSLKHGSLLLVQKDIHPMRLEGKPVEIRFLFQHTSSGYKLRYHFIKIGGNPVTSNLGGGGKAVRTLEGLQRVFEHAFPATRAEEVERMAKAFFEEARAMAEAEMNDNPLYRQPIRVFGDRLPLRFPGTTRSFMVYAPPVLSTVDIAPHHKGNSVFPVGMEHHAEGNFGMRDELEQGVLDQRTLDMILRTDDLNYCRIVKEARAQVASMDREERMHAGN